MGQLFIDLPDGGLMMPFGDVLEAAEIAKRERGRLRMVVNASYDSRNPMFGCIQLGDWRPAKEDSKK